LGDTALRALFETIPVGEVWGVGRQLTAQLEAMGIQTVQQLRQADSRMIRARFSVVLERTVQELRGASCMDIEDVIPEPSRSSAADPLAA
jgi:DNA polymerase V